MVRGSRWSTEESDDSEDSGGYQRAFVELHGTGVCAWRQVDVCGGKRAVRASRRIPRIQMEVEESAEFEGSGGSRRAFVELRGIRQTPKLEAATECTRHGKC